MEGQHHQPAIAASAVKNATPEPCETPAVHLPWSQTDPGAVSAPSVPHLPASSSVHPTTSPAETITQAGSRDLTNAGGAHTGSIPASNGQTHRVISPVCSPEVSLPSRPLTTAASLGLSPDTQQTAQNVDSHTPVPLHPATKTSSGLNPKLSATSISLSAAAVGNALTSTRTAVDLTTISDEQGPAEPELPSLIATIVTASAHPSTQVAAAATEISAAALLDRQRAAQLQHEWMAQHVMLPALRMFLRPQRQRATDGSVVQVASLERMYKIFERC